MKNFSISFLSLLLLLTIVGPGCKKDEESDREKFLGVYSVVENCPSFGVGNYDITISTSASADNAIVITNFGNFAGISVTGTVAGNGLTIPQQTVTVQGNALGISGSGTINGISLSITYTFSIGGVGETCSMSCTKK